MSDHVCGPVLAASAHEAAMEAFCPVNLRKAAELGNPRSRATFYVTDDMIVSHADHAAKFVAADARKLVALFAAARETLGKPGMQCVLLLAPGQGLCSQTGPERARVLLADAGVAAYRLRA
jgi:hypothetical protein